MAQGDSLSLLRSRFGGFDPVELARLRAARRSELQGQLAGDLGVGDVNSVRRRKFLLDTLDDDIADDPFTGDAERRRVAGITGELDEAALMQRPEIGEAEKVGAERNAFARFLAGREGTRGTFAAEMTPEGEGALDARSRRRQAENESALTGRLAYSQALRGARGGVDESPAGPSPYAAERATRNKESVDELLGKVSRLTTGMGSLSAFIPETPARNFKAELDTLKANIAFGELTAMREASKTGGALGQISNRELDLLSSALGALDPGQSPTQIAAQLKKVRDSIERWERAVSGMSGGGQEAVYLDDDGNPR